ncbi:MAG: ERCC4 domain-containing protein [Candidatus Riflebacteria bacterium]|nr:ERCC4 domain-containing protein [Candidatus Riflebacteria bacterium]
MKQHYPIPAIIVDTREQKPYMFDSATILRKLDIGDYSLNGFEDQFAIERKELNDFISCMIDKAGCENRSRFERELARAHEKLRRLWILVEADFDDIMAGRFQSEIKVTSVIATIIAWQNRYPVQFVWGGNRPKSARLAKIILERSFRDFVDKKINSKGCCNK